MAVPVGTFKDNGEIFSVALATILLLATMLSNYAT